MTWTLTDDGEFVLDDAFQERLNQIKSRLRMGWLERLCDELAASTGYDREELMDEFLTRCEKWTSELPVEMVDEFIIQALEEDLCLNCS